MESFGAKLKALRERHGLTQEELAKSLGVDKNTVWRWENDERMPRRANLQMIANFFGMGTGEVMDDFASSANPPPLQISLLPANPEGSKINLSPFYTALEEARRQAEIMTHSERIQATQMLKWAIEELEAKEVNRSAEQS